MTWSNADALHPRPSVSQHSSRYQRYAQNSGYDVSKRRKRLIERRSVLDFRETKVYKNVSNLA